MNEISIYCKNNASFVEVAVGSSILDIYRNIDYRPANQPVAAFVNNRSQGLNYRCYGPKTIEFVGYESPAGQRTYVRSLCHILSKAAHDVLPEAALCIEHPVSKGYYCVLNGVNQVDKTTARMILKRMKEIVAANLPFIEREINTEDAIELFRQSGMDDKVRLAETMGRIYTSYHELDGYINCFYGSLVPSSGYITNFDLIPYFDGLLLRIPRRDNPAELEPIVRQDKMFGIYKESQLLLKALGVRNAGDLNHAVAQGRSREMIMVAEAMQEKKIAKIAEEIAERYNDGLRIVLISGPSSSGKTTFAKRLGIQLKTNMYHPQSLSLDDYFLPRSSTPRDESGDYDYESLYALDLEYFNADLDNLLKGDEIKLPTYDFKSGMRIYKPDNNLKLTDKSLLIIEGIHALNPQLTENIAAKHKYGVYVSALTSISIDNHNWIPTADNRLLRRIVRDYRFRNYSPE